MEDNGSPELPELIIGLVAAIGTPIDKAVDIVSDTLTDEGYSVETLHLSNYADRFQLQTPPAASNASFLERLQVAMSRGSELRERTEHNDILALAAIADIHQMRSQNPKSSYVLRQLKHPEEIRLLRQTYDDRFLAIGFYLPASDREDFLHDNDVNKSSAKHLIATDEHEGVESGQRFRDTFHLSDVFVRIDNEGECKKEIKRFVSLVLGKEIISPRKEEFGMFHAYGSSLRSSQMGRQVGASILSHIGDLIAVGANEVPQYGGGSYWETNGNGYRDHELGVDSNDRKKRDIQNEIIEKIKRSISTSSKDDNIESLVSDILENSRVGSLIEFGRAVHAEADALASAARLGRSSVGADLFCTTFPCHLCAKQIVSSGIRSVTFIEPYPKSLAEELHGDAISVEHKVKGKVHFKPFIGVAPRRYAQLFSDIDFTGERIKRKRGDGRAIVGELRPRLRYFEDSVLLREEMAAGKLIEITKGKKTGNEFA